MQPVARWQAMDDPRRDLTNPASGQQSYDCFNDLKRNSHRFETNKRAKPAEHLPALQTSERKVELASTGTEPERSLSLSGLQSHQFLGATGSMPLTSQNDADNNALAANTQVLGD